MVSEAAVLAYKKIQAVEEIAEHSDRRVIFASVHHLEVGDLMVTDNAEIIRVTAITPLNHWEVGIYGIVLSTGETVRQRSFYGTQVFQTQGV